MAKHLITSAGEGPQVPFTFKELETFTADQIILRAQEYFGADWFPDWMSREEALKRGLIHA